MTNERRDHDRESLLKAEIPGNFSIEANGESYSFTRVNDVSISGMGIVIKGELNIGQEIAIKYSSPEFSISITGSIAWCVEEGDNLYRIGVQFSTADLDANVMLFMTLREYIDDFGETF